MERVHDDEDGPFPGLNDIKEDIAQTLGADLAVLKEKMCDQADLNVTPDEIFDFDIELATTRGSLWSQEILVDITRDQAEVSDNENDQSVEGEPVTKLGIKSYSNPWEFQPFFKILRSDDETLKRNKW